VLLGAALELWLEVAPPTPALEVVPPVAATSSPTASAQPTAHTAPKDQAKIGLMGTETYHIIVTK
jgi:hypothetical protein